MSPLQHAEVSESETNTWKNNSQQSPRVKKTETSDTCANIAAEKNTKSRGSTSKQCQSSRSEKAKALAHLSSFEPATPRRFGNTDTALEPLDQVSPSLKDRGPTRSPESPYTGRRLAKACSLDYDKDPIPSRAALRKDSSNGRHSADTGARHQRCDDHEIPQPPSIPQRNARLQSSPGAFRVSSSLIDSDLDELDSFCEAESSGPPPSEEILVNATVVTDDEDSSAMDADVELGRDAESSLGVFSAVPMGPYFAKVKKIHLLICIAIILVGCIGIMVGFLMGRSQQSTATMLTPPRRPPPPRPQNGHGGGEGRNNKGGGNNGSNSSGGN